MSWITKKLNFTVDLQELEEYYNDLKSNHENLRWDFHKCFDYVKKEWQDRINSHNGADQGYGWAIQSNHQDISIACPPYNISTMPTCDYRNTEMAKGIILRLQEALPFAYRWSLFVQLPGGTVPRHVDDIEEYTGHIPLFWDNTSVFEMGWDESNLTTITMPPGGAYLLNTVIPHATFNRSDLERVGLVFRINRKDYDKILNVTGQI